MDVTQVIIAIIAVFGAIVTRVVIPLIKAKTTAQQWSNIVSWTNTAVNAAEVIFKGAGKGEQKRDYVLDYIHDCCNSHNIGYDEKAVRNALEEAWRDMVK